MNSILDQKSYTVKTEGFILGTFLKVGERIKLNVRQAREFVREGRLVEIATGSKKKASAATEPPK